MQNVYNKELTKEVVFNSIQHVFHIKGYLGETLRVVGVHYKPVVTKSGEEKLLTIMFVKAESGEVYSVFSSAKSFYNATKTLVEVFGENIKDSHVDVVVTQVEIVRDQTIYKVSLV